MDLHYTSPPKEHLKVSDNFIKLVKQNEKNAKSKGLDLVGASYLDLVRLRDSIQSDYVLSETALKTLIKKSLAKLAKTREAEGKTTNADMKRLSSKMQKSLNKIKRMEKQNTQHMQKKFKRIKAELKLSNKEINMGEVFSSFSKADINEEVVRFQSHLDLVTKLMKSKDLIGKKLDFYTQEMLRETNTLSSKALIAEIKNEAVELKSLIEKMKEHAQNVE
jgi:uncharacterized protein (TIGR00255 family)